MAGEKEMTDYLPRDEVLKIVMNIEYLNDNPPLEIADDIKKVCRDAAYNNNWTALYDLMRVVVRATQSDILNKLQALDTVNEQKETKRKTQRRRTKTKEGD